MKKIALAFGILLSACSPSTTGDHGGHAVPERDTSAFAVEDKSVTGELGFAVTEGGKPFADYGVSHTKRMHLIVVRDDLTQFSHLHPVQDQDGVWRVPFVPSEGGDYWIYADFVDAKGMPIVIRFERSYPGAGDTAYAPQPGKSFDDEERGTGEEKVIDGYRVLTSAVRSGDDVTLFFKILDARTGAVPALEDYLGAKGHVILLSRDGEFLHVHPEDALSGNADDPVVFTARVKESGTYRIFAQFQIGGAILTAPFDWVRP